MFIKKKRNTKINYQFYIAFAVLSIILSTQVTSCKQENRKLTAEEAAKYKEPLVKVNKMLVDKDEERIKAFIERRKWEMEMTNTGLWYKILEDGEGETVETNDIVTFSYKVSLLNGTVCYTSDSTGNKSFVVGRGGVENGLEEGILLLQKGDSVRFIMPPHLAHGLVGDDDKIPPRSTIIYELKLLEIHSQ